MGFQAFPRRTEENLQGKTDQLGGLSICGTEKTRIIGKNITSLFFIACPPTVFSPRI